MMNSLAEPILVAIDNGGTNTRVNIIDGGETLSHSYATPPDYDTAIDEIACTVQLMTDKPIDAVGFAIAGNVSDGKIIEAGELQDFGWVNRPFQADVATSLGVEQAAIVLLNDCVAAAKAQQVSNKATGGPSSGYVETISTGFGGAGFTEDSLIADEPGHEFLEAGALCGCGKDGCAEAHISGSGIYRNLGIKAEDLPDEVWAQEIIPKAVNAHVQLLERLAASGFKPHNLYMFGSVALKAPHMFNGIRFGLEEHFVTDPISVQEATHGEDSGIVGAGAAAKELLS